MATACIGARDPQRACRTRHGAHSAAHARDSGQESARRTRPDARFLDAFSIDVPFFPGATYQADIRTQWAVSDGYSVAFARFAGLRPGGGPIHATLYAGVELLQPAQQATEVDVAAVLRWRPSGSPGVYRLRIEGFVRNYWYGSALLYTARTEVAPAEIPALHGFMRSGATYRWFVSQFPTASRVDDLLTARDAKEEAASESSGWEFTTRAAVPAVP